MSFKRRACCLAGGVTVAAAAAMLNVAPAVADEQWAAVAYSPDDEYFGSGNRAATEHDAQSMAVFDCVKRGGTSCQVAASTSNGCVALGDNDTQWGGNVGGNLAGAEHNVAAQLGGPVRILISTCSWG